MENFELPQALTSLIGSESYDFAVKAGLRRPLTRSAGHIGFGFLFTVATGIFALIFLAAAKNADPAASDQGSDTPVILLFSFFLITGITIMISGIIKAFRSGGYFVGISKGLINYRNGKHSLTDWQRFAGDTRVTGNNARGTITLIMRPENLSNAEAEIAYVPGVIYITAIRDAFEVERMIRKRIKGNDPTPAVR